MYYKDWDTVLEGDTVRLTPVTEEDSETFFLLRLEKNPMDHAEAVGFCSSILDHTEVREYHAVRLKDRPEMIGWIALQKDEEWEPDIGIGFLPEYQNHGYGPEAVKILLNWLHSEYGIDKAYVWIKKQNIQSQKAFAKVGAQRIGQNPDEEGQNILLRGAFRDHPEALDKMVMYHYVIRMPIK